METKLLKIINHYGIDNQQRKLEEEVFEFQKAILQYEYEQVSVKDNIEEEVGDVLNVLYQFILYYKLDMNKITESRISKIDRTIGDIEK